MEAVRRYAQFNIIQAGDGWDAAFSSPEDAIVKKMEFFRAGGSDKHLRDIAGVVKTSGSEIDRVYIDRWATTFMALHELGSTRYSQALPRGVSPTALGVRLSGYATTTACFLTNPGSNSMPRPGPVGTVTTPPSVFSDDVLHSNGTSSLKPLNSWYGPALGIADTK